MCFLCCVGSYSLEEESFFWIVAYLFGFDEFLFLGEMICFILSEKKVEWGTLIGCERLICGISAHELSTITSRRFSIKGERLIYLRGLIHHSYSSNVPRPHKSS